MFMRLEISIERFMIRVNIVWTAFVVMTAALLFNSPALRERAYSITSYVTFEFVGAAALTPWIIWALMRPLTSPALAYLRYLACAIYMATIFGFAYLICNWIVSDMLFHF